MAYDFHAPAIHRRSDPFSGWHRNTPNGAILHAHIQSVKPYLDSPGDRVRDRKELGILNPFNDSIRAAHRERVGCRILDRLRQIPVIDGLPVSHRLATPK